MMNRRRATAARFVTQFGEGFIGKGVHAAHVNTVLGAKGGSVETAWVSALAQPSAGHAPFVAVLQPGLALKPFTLFVNKATTTGRRHAELTWGAAQAGVAKGVIDAVAAGTIAADAVDDLLLIAAVWVNPGARDASLVFTNNAQATLAALRAGSRRLPRLEDLLSARGAPFNAFFRAPG